MERPDYIFVNFEKPRDAAMRNTGMGFVVLSLCARNASRPQRRPSDVFLFVRCRCVHKKSRFR